MEKIIILIFCLYGLQSASGQINLGNIFQNFGNFGRENGTVNRISEMDAVGSFIKLIDTVLTDAYRGRPPPKGSLCDTHMMILGEYEIKVSEQPRGYCSYCCRMIKPAKYVRLYFASKASGNTGNNTIELKMSKKAGALRSAGVDSNSPTVIYIHGFSEYGLGPAPRAIRDAYLSLDQNYNIILVDWGDLTPMPWYPQGVQNTKLVANVLSKLIKFYNSTGELPISNVHLVGFSLGAHIAGFVGKKFQGAQKIPRITALDPAFPLYLTNDTSQRLAKDDAEFIDVIHTDGGKFGFPKSLGDVDFYPNGGISMQPGCTTSNLAEHQHIEAFVACDHLRAWQYYAESVRNPTAFPATQCGIMKEGLFKQCPFTTQSYMGFMASKTTTMGDFYCITNGEKPFSKSAKEQESNMKTVNLIL